MKLRHIGMLVLVTATVIGCGQSAPPPDPALTSQATQVAEVAPAPMEPAPAPAPAVDTAAAPAGGAGKPGSPALPNEIILQDFEAGNGTEGMDVYSWDSGKAKAEVQSERANFGARALRTQGDYWGVNFNKREVDLSGYKYLFVWIYDTVGDNTIEFTVADMSEKEAKCWTSDKSKKNEWAKITINLDQFRNQVDLKKVRNIRFYEWNPGTYYIDDLGAGK